MANLDRVTEVSRQSLDALPSVVERSRRMARERAGELLADLKFWFFVVVGAVAILLVVALACFYWLSLEIINETHREVLRLSGRPYQ